MTDREAVLLCVVLVLMVACHLRTALRLRALSRAVLLLHSLQRLKEIVK